MARKGLRASSRAEKLPCYLSMSKTALFFVLGRLQHPPRDTWWVSLPSRCCSPASAEQAPRLRPRALAQVVLLPRMASGVRRRLWLLCAAFFGASLRSLVARSLQAFNLSFKSAASKSRAALLRPPAHWEAASSQVLHVSTACCGAASCASVGWSFGRRSWQSPRSSRCP